MLPFKTAVPAAPFAAMNANPTSTKARVAVGCPSTPGDAFTSFTSKVPTDGNFIPALTGL